MTPTSSPVHPSSLSRQQMYSAIGSLIGAAAGDALGAPFEFRPGGLYKKTFPAPVLGGIGEMIGGGAFQWAPGEFTDDTQMAVALAEALLADGVEFNPQRVWDHFVAWSHAATDIGNTTRLALSGDDYRNAAEEAHTRMGASGGNGSVMRIAPIGIAGVQWGAEKTKQIAFAQASLTHYDPLAGLSAYIAAELIRQLILDGSVEGALQEIATNIDEASKDIFDTLFMAPWHPEEWTQHGNGYSIVCLAQAVWAVRTTSSFEDAVTTAVNLGDDADTVGAVTGAIAGALYGIQNIPARWVTYLHGTVAQPDGSMKTYHQHDLIALAHQLVGKSGRRITELEPPIEPAQVHNLGVFATNASGAPLASSEMGIVSLCRMEDALHQHPHRREFYIVDQWGQGDNPYLDAVTRDAVDTIDAFLNEGRNVVVHCHGGRSRTGFILKAWYMRKFNVDHYEAEEWIESVWPHYVTWNNDFMDFLDNEWSK